MKTRENKDFILDAYALLAFLEGEEGGETVRALLESPGISLYISVINLGEVYYTVLRERGKNAANIVESEVRRAENIRVVDASWERAKIAGEFKTRGKISYADCFAAALAVERNAPLLTGDDEFERVADSVEIIWLKRKK